MDFLALHQAVFWHDDDWGDIPPQIHAYTLTPTANDAPAVYVVISYAQNDAQAINLSYFIERADWLSLPAAAQDSSRADYLWERDCLECFIGFDGKADYYEMNFSPDSSVNAYNLYQFTDYRTPNIMPPMQAAGQIIVKNNNATSGMNDDYLAYHLSINIDDIITNPNKINPCAILYQDNQPTFYATHHAPTPDFHDKAFWQILS